MADRREAANDAPAKRDLRQEVTDRIVSMLDREKLPWSKPWDAEKGAAALELPFNPTTEKSYRGGNALSLMAVGIDRGFDDPRWMTYRQAEQKGYQVRAGERGTQIEYWEFKGGSAREAKGDGERDDESTAPRGSVLQRVFTVFNASQIDGVPPYERKQRETWEVEKAGETILANSGARIAHDQRDSAFYSPLRDEIHLPPKSAFPSASAYYGTALHELGHWTGHSSRLARSTMDTGYQFGSPEYAKEELRAELTSVFLAAERGIPHNTEQHAAYIKSWSKALREDKNELFKAAKDAHRAADLLLALERGVSLDVALEELDQPRAKADKTVERLVPITGADKLSDREANRLVEIGKQVARDLSIHVGEEGGQWGYRADEIAARTLSSKLDLSENGSDYSYRSQRDAYRSIGENASLIATAAANGAHAMPLVVDAKVRDVCVAACSRERINFKESFEAARDAVREALGPEAEIVIAKTSANGYRGKLIGVTDHHVVQQIGDKKAVAHRKRAIEGELPERGTNIGIDYVGGKGRVAEIPGRALGRASDGRERGR